MACYVERPMRLKTLLPWLFGLAACGQADPNGSAASARRTFASTSSAPVAAEHKLTRKEPKLIGDLTFTFVGERRRYRGANERAHDDYLELEVVQGSETQRVSSPAGVGPQVPQQSFGVVWRVIDVSARHYESVTIEILPVHTDADCAAICAATGHCTASEGHCTAARDASCREAAVCKASGECSADSGRCVAKKSEDCKASSPCKANGACTAKDGRCVPGSAEDCKASAICSSRGACSLVNGACDQGSDADCKIAPGCAANGECSFIDGRCDPGSAADCQRSKSCIEGGYCALGKGDCLRGSQADCEKDSSWKGLTVYSQAEKRCVPQCRKSTLCTSLGMCTENGGYCQATSDEDCRASEECKRLGKCKPADLSCSPGSDADCRAAAECKTLGNCSRHKRGTFCAPGSDDDCKASDACKSSGKCKAGSVSCER